MPRDRTGEEQPPDDLFSGPHPQGCHHGQIEEFYDEAGELLGHERWHPDYADRVVRSITLPCPRCRPAQHARWAAGCYRMDGSHDHEHCTYCQEDGRNAPRPPR